MTKHSIEMPDINGEGLMAGYLIKLVRDDIKESFEHDHHELAFSPLGRITHIRALRCKLAEEVGEYLVDPSLDELVDILDIIKALAAIDLGENWAKVEGAAAEKCNRRGGFGKGTGMFASEVVK